MPTPLTRRQAYDQAQRRRATIIAGSSTFAVLLAIVILVPMAPGWVRVKASFFNGEVFAIALCRDARAPALFPLRIFGAAYTDIFRGIPVILVVYLIGFGIPGLGLPRPYNSPYIWYSAYVAEIFRSGIESVHPSQRAAAQSLGLSDRDVMRYVVLPQAIRRVVPANMNMLIALQKDVALLSFIGPVEILRQAGVFKSLLANFTPYVAAAVIFLAVTIPATRFADYLMSKQARARS